MAQRCLDNGTVVILTTIPPQSGRLRECRDYAAAVRRVARELRVPLVDYFSEILARRPTDWDGSLPRFRQTPGDDYQVPTLIARDGVHPSNPDRYAAYSDEDLRNNGYALGTYLTLMVYADVVTKVLHSSLAESVQTGRWFVTFLDVAAVVAAVAAVVLGLRYWITRSLAPGRP